MPTRPPSPAVPVCVLAAVLGWAPSTALAQGGKQPEAPATARPGAPKDATGSGGTAPPAQKQPTNAELLDDFVHFSLIDKPDLANSVGQALIDRRLAPAELVRLVESSSLGYAKFSKAVIRAEKVAGTERVAAGLLSAYESGKLGMARNPEAIGASLKNLTGTQQERLYARERLIRAGEYAAPQLLPALLDSTNSPLQAEVRQVLVEMGRQAIMPLCAALPRLAPTEQEQVLRLLGDIPYPASGPFVCDLLARPATPGVRNAALSAASRVLGNADPAYPVADRFADLADDYYNASPSLISFPHDPNQLFWSYAPGAGLTFRAIDTRIYPAMMAMWLSEEALKRDSSSQRALATWLAANFAREIRTPPGYVNPIYSRDRREAMYYAVAAGSGPSQAVLARAVDTADAQLARRALAAIERTAGGRSLWTAGDGSVAGMGGGRAPILEALRFPNRRVQYDAALALASAGPRESFTGSEQVVRILGSAIRDAGSRFALVLAADTERQASLSDLFRSQGYTPLPPGTRLDDAAQAIADVPGVDLVVLDLPAPSTRETIERAHVDAKLRATPILALLTAQGYSELSPRFSRDGLIRLARAGLAPKEIVAAAQQLSESAVGGELKPEEATAYKSRSLGVLRDLGVSANGVLNIGDAQGALLASLPDAKGDMKMRIADVLAYIPTAASQNALMAAAMAATGDERVKLLARLTESAKRGGNRLDAGNVARLIDLASKGQGEEATAAAALMGALNLPNARLVPLILEKSE